jgi:hypothetical protein
MDEQPNRCDPTVPAILMGPYASPLAPSASQVDPIVVKPRDVNPLIAFVTNPSMKKRSRDTPSTDALPVPW